MAVTMQLPISEARGVLQDTRLIDGVNYRYTDADLLLYANDSLDVMVDHLPFLFTAIVPFTCVDGVRQLFPSTGSKGVIDVVEVVNGNGLVKVDLDALDNFAPTWRNGKRLPATNWVDVENSAYDFLLYPPAPVGQVLNVQHVATPPTYLMTDVLDTRLISYTHLISDYICGMAEAREAEGVGPDREQMFIQTFIAKLKAISAKGIKNKS